MTSKIQSVQDDLAFMKALAEGGPAPQWATFGQTYLAGGLIYGAQCLFHWGQAADWYRPAPPLATGIALGFTVVFLVVLGWILWRSRKTPPVGMTSRAIKAAFSAAGTTNLVMVCLFGLAASQRHSMTIWLLYPATVFALQGAAWMAAAILQRRAWMAVTAVGWFVSTIALGLSIDSAVYTAICGASLLLWMALPGALLVLQSRRAS